MAASAASPVSATVSITPARAAFERLRVQAPVLRREDAAARIVRLRRLAAWLTANRVAIQTALYADFRKPAAETDLTEIWSTQAEIKHVIAHLKQWMAPKRVGTPLSLFGTRSWVQYEPKGVCLIIAPWNYPFYLAVGPLVSALAAGNCCVLKPSELTPHVATLLRRLAAEVFDPAEVVVVEGDKTVATELLSFPFDHIFFTGSPEVGKIVMRAAAEHLSGVTLELGGKSPAVVDATANLRDTAEKLVWGKFLNAGQTCVAPDYVLVQEPVQEALVREMEAVIRRSYNPAGAGVDASESFARIVNRQHFNRLAGLLEEAQTAGASVAIGGEIDSSHCFIAPTVLTQVPPESRLMQEEIFGPLLPLVPFHTLAEAADFINSRPKPLAQYIFTRNAENQRYLLQNVSAGGAAVNETIVHLGHSELPFGGVGNSGVGKAHGHYGFLAFSNEKAVLKQRVGRTSIKLLYPPYTPKVQKMLDLLLRYL
ncbi:aldehyde dehydrogenase family protein [Hymenobacter lutimineralis]|uniref:Aldehyde dehydrogenase n=1 Tax=Hymenobacter lutimineralis TaxID=2606448 RepID=A0A5D6V0M1_9BACT|nr:aldehyde dehydrogenase family protein [Hymenobacter lutimineralis]TYZ09343.1 aldehyde dehydrogenase family protein [Hymenobacter lutimineralis]